MQLDGWVMFTLVILAAMAIIIWEVGGPKAAAQAVETAAEGFDKDHIAAAALVAGQGDFSANNDPWARMPWETWR